MYLAEYEIFLQSDTEEIFFSSTLPDLVRVGIEAITFSYFAVAWHRYLLIEGDDGRPRLLRPWRLEHWRYFLYGGLIFGVPYLLVREFVGGLHFLRLGLDVFSIWLVLIPAGGVACWLWLRLSLVFPGAAVGARGYGLGQSWKDTRGSAFDILVALVAIYLPVWLGSVALGWGIGLFHLHRSTWIPLFDGARAVTVNAVGGILLSMASEFLMLAVTVSAFSLSFRYLGMRDARPPREPGPWDAPAS